MFIKLMKEMKGKRKLLSLMAADQQRSMGVLSVPDRNHPSTHLLNRSSDDRIKEAKSISTLNSKYEQELMRRRIEVLRLKEKERASMRVDARQQWGLEKRLTQRKKGSVLLSKVVPIEEEPDTKPPSPQPMRPKKKGSLRNGSWRALHKYNEVKFTGQNGTLFTNEKLSRAILSEEGSLSPPSRLPKGAGGIGKILRGGATRRKDSAITLSPQSSLSPVLMNTSVVFNLPSGRTSSKSLLSKTARQPFHSLSPASFQTPISPSPHSFPQPQPSPDPVLPKNIKRKHFKSPSDFIERKKSNTKENKSAIKGFVNIDRLFNRQPLPKLMVKEIELRTEPRSQTSLQFFSKRNKESPELVLPDTRRSYITPQYLLDREQIRHSTNFSALRKETSKPLSPKLAPIRPPFSRTTFSSDLAASSSLPFSEAQQHTISLIKSSRVERQEPMRKADKRSETKGSEHGTARGSWSGGWEIERRVTTPQNMNNKEVSANLESESQDFVEQSPVRGLIAIDIRSGRRF